MNYANLIRNFADFFYIKQYKCPRAAKTCCGINRDFIGDCLVEARDTVANIV